MRSTAHEFAANARKALRDPVLAEALARSRTGFVERRREAVALVPEFDYWRGLARAAKDRALARLDEHLVTFESRVVASGGQVHWARDAAEARALIVDLCRAAQARCIAKGKSMATEEIDLNDALLAAGFEVVETDLGEYILQLGHEYPSHIIAPAIHKTRGQVAELFRRHHPRAPGGDTDSVADLVAQARAVLRRTFLTADVGITGANFLVAETGSTVLVTNEGNGDLSASLPRVHIVVAGIEKMVARLEDLTPLLRVLARSGTGQAMTAYTTVFTGPRRSADEAGPEAFHVVLIDSGRSDLLASDLRPILRCIRCGACLNHCPVYSAVGGHAYGWVMSGPMGAVLTPAMLGLERAPDLPHACTLNGRCEVVCPVQIPLPDLIRRLRERQFASAIGHRGARLALRLWAWVAAHPGLYRPLVQLARHALKHGSRRLTALPLARAWLAQRDLPHPARDDSGSTL